MAPAAAAAPADPGPCPSTPPGLHGSAQVAAAEAAELAAARSDSAQATIDAIAAAEAAELAAVHAAIAEADAREAVEAAEAALAHAKNLRRIAIDFACARVRAEGLSRHLCRRSAP